MIASIQPAPEVFTPLTLNIQLETQKEVDVLLSLLECAPVTQALKRYGVFTRPIWDAFVHRRKETFVTSLTLDIEEEIRNDKPIKQQ